MSVGRRRRPRPSFLALRLTHAASGIKATGHAFLADAPTIGRRLHRGRGRLRRLGRLPGVGGLPGIGARRDSVLRSLYLLFNEGYQRSTAMRKIINSPIRHSQ